MAKPKEVSEQPSDYRLIARAAYDNATDLRDEARFLLEKNSPRAFALAVACIEELMKALMADLISKGSAKPEDLQAEFKGRKWPMLTHHGSKQHLFALFLLLQAAKKEGPEKVASVDKILRESLTTDAIGVEGKDQIIELVTEMEDRRQDSLYVGIKVAKGRVKTPRTETSHAMSIDLLRKVDEFLPYVEANLKTPTEKYQSEAAKLNAERKARV